MSYPGLHQLVAALVEAENTALHALLVEGNPGYLHVPSSTLQGGGGPGGLGGGGGGGGGKGLPLASWIHADVTSKCILRTHVMPRCVRALLSSSHP